MPKYKNIDLVNIRIPMLQKSVDNCESGTPELSSTIAKYLEKALNNKEIDESEYGIQTLTLDTANNRFKRECVCNKRWY